MSDFSTYKRIGLACTLCALALVSGCASQRPTGANAPVEDRGTMAGRAAPSSTAPVAVASSPASPVSVANPVAAPTKALQGSENAGKPGHYTVRPGDTLIRIGLDAGQSWRDIARWNNMDNPNIIEVGQVLRVIPPGTVAVAAAPLPATSGAPVSDAVVTRPVSTPSPVTAGSVPAPGTPTANVASPPMPPASSPSDEEVAWLWPVAGGVANVVATFDEVKNKGVDISGKLGDAILAAGDGRVVYAGAGLRGYGNLVILKHNNTYLTAYAHNQTLLVKEDQTVRRGQKIAEMGNSDADRVKLHFEIRRQGKPVDPMRFLPAR